MLSFFGRFFIKAIFAGWWLFLCVIYAKEEHASRLIILIVFDQMKAEYLNFFAPLFCDSGFKKVMERGVVFENAIMDVFPTHTAVGHATISTGKYPAAHGIIGNKWYDRRSGKSIYCVDDFNYVTVGGGGLAGQKSPSRLLEKTFADKIIEYYGGKARVLSLSVKDRSAILIAGHSPKHVYWFAHDYNVFVTSSYYRKDLPPFIVEANARKPWMNHECLYWDFLLEPTMYFSLSGTPDNNQWEATFPGNAYPAFPHNLEVIYDSSGISPFQFSHCSMKTLFELALTGMEALNMGEDSIPDLVLLSISTTDIIGHMFGTHSWELMDIYARADRYLASFLSSVEKKYKNFLLVITSDHGAYPTPPQHPFISIVHTRTRIDSVLTSLIKKKAGKAIPPHLSPTLYFDGYLLYLDISLLKQYGLTPFTAISFLDSCKKEISPGIKAIVPVDGLDFFLEPFIKNVLSNSIYPGRSPDAFVITHPGWQFMDRSATTHGSPWDYDAHIPLVIYSPQIAPTHVRDTISITLLHDFILWKAGIRKVPLPHLARYCHAD